MTAFEEEDYLQLSGLQHFLFCRRQWALIHIENQWQESGLTMDGTLMHERAHEAPTEKRGDVIITHGMAVCSPTLGLSGQCDVVEFHRSPQGVPIHGWEDRWLPFPVEYKRGAPKNGACDEAQLCAEALCLGEMLCTPIPTGALYYGEPRRRVAVEFTEELCALVRDSVREMHEYARRGYTPKVKPTRQCSSCSLRGLCLPELLPNRSVAAYLEEFL